MSGETTSAAEWGATSSSRPRKPRAIRLVCSTAASELNGSPVAFDGLVFEGVSGGSAELGDRTDRYDFQGSFVLLDATTGALVKKTWTIHPPDVHDGFAGAGIWSAPTIDVQRQVLYVATGDNYSDPPSETSDAILAFELATGRLLWHRQVTGSSSRTCAGTARHGFFRRIRSVTRSNPRSPSTSSR